MLCVAVLDMVQDGDESLSALLKDAFAKRALPIKRLAVYNNWDAFSKNADELIRTFHAFLFSFSTMQSDYIRFVQILRRQSENAFVVFALDRSVDISACVRPSVRPSGVLFIPLEARRVHQTVREIYMEYLRADAREQQPVFSIKSGGDYYSVSTGDISFFEARGKKIAVKTRGQEILFYSNFDSVMGQLPEWFIRCHKGYVVNTRQIVRTSFADMTLTLQDQAVIPFSRSYRDAVRNYVR